MDEGGVWEVAKWITPAHVGTVDRHEISLWMETLWGPPCVMQHAVHHTALSLSHTAGRVFKQACVLCGVCAADKLSLGEVVQSTATVGSNVELVRYKNIQMEVSAGASLPA